MPEHQASEGNLEGFLDVSSAERAFALYSPASCIKNRLMGAFTAQNIGFSDRNGVLLMFTAGEDKPYA